LLDVNARAIASDSDALLQARAAAPRRPLVMYQRWEKLLFLHWTLNPEELQPTLPRGLTIDTYQGEAFVGVSPFFMRNVRPPRLPSLPWISNFQELNVRTYVKDRSGVPGIWFYSLDCNQPFAVVGARLWLGLPYYRAKMSASQNDGIDYGMRRKGLPNGRGISIARSDPHVKPNTGLSSSFCSNDISFTPDVVSQDHSCECR
jgi:uncharacterized protein YqjF (DUF2071 family)